jgi:two-component system response regulator FlrC
VAGGKLACERKRSAAFRVARGHPLGHAPILIVDDDPQLRKVLSEALARSGFAVQTASGGREALELLERQRFGVVITDVKMPDTCGMEVLKAVKQRTPQLPVIAMTGYGSVANAVEAMQNGACDYLLKPFPLESLESIVRRSLGPADPAGGNRSDAGNRSLHKAFITQDSRMLETLELARRVARSKAAVLIQGESGTGKELLAAFIHRYSLYPQAPYVAVNCAALPETLAESELFGHERGAFTGAVNRKIGKFELAKNGTLVLDEIGEMPLSLQAKLLRVLQEKEIDRVGGSRPIPIDARVIAVTNRDLSASVDFGSFREDLYYRIHGVLLEVPPLRERPGDIVLLAGHFLERCNSESGRGGCRFSDGALELMRRHPWRGNVRELENAVERAVIIAEGDTIHASHLNLVQGPVTLSGPAGQPVLSAGTTVWEMERRLITTTLSEVDQNRTRAAELLGISIRTLRNKLREYKSTGGTTVPASGPASPRAGHSPGYGT